MALNKKYLKLVNSKEDIPIGTYAIHIERLDKYLCVYYFHEETTIDLFIFFGTYLKIDGTKILYSDVKFIKKVYINLCKAASEKFKLPEGLDVVSLCWLCTRYKEHLNLECTLYDDRCNICFNELRIVN